MKIIMGNKWSKIADTDKKVNQMKDQKPHEKEKEPESKDSSGTVSHIKYNELLLYR